MPVRKTTRKSQPSRNAAIVVAEEKRLGAKGELAKQRIISVAETFFTRRGFDGASMRDIAAFAKMQPASMYYYFSSKEELLWAVWEKGGLELLQRVEDAVAKSADPMERLRTATLAHVEGLHDWRRANQVLFIMPPWHYPESIRDRVIALRDRYENIFIELIDHLPLKRGVDRHYFRLALIGALSWSLFWFKPGQDSLETLTTNILNIILKGVEK